MVFKRDEESELRYYMVTQIIERAEPQCRFEDVKLDGLILHVKNVISRLQSNAQTATNQKTKMTWQK
jgi:hypothetical protein